MIAQQKMVDVIANNLANANTTGFKRSRASFEDVLYETVQGPRVVDGNGILGPMQIGRGVRLAAVTRIHGNGTMEITNRPLDLAIEGDGFFQVKLTDGRTGYTRDGSFTINDSGQLVTHAGHHLLPDVVLPPDASVVTISEKAPITVTAGGFGRSDRAGRIELARFANPSGLLTWAAISTSRPRHRARRFGQPRRGGLDVRQGTWKAATSNGAGNDRHDRGARAPTKSTLVPSAQREDMMKSIDDSFVTSILPLRRDRTYRGAHRAQAADRAVGAAGDPAERVRLAWGCCAGTIPRLRRPDGPPERHRGQRLVSGDRDRQVQGRGDAGARGSGGFGLGGRDALP